MGISSFLQDFSPLHARQMQYLLDRLQIQVVDVKKGFSGANYADRFSLLVPFCLDYIKWDIIFNSEYPWHPPDVIFPAEDENFQIAMVEDHFQTSSHSAWNILSDWDVKDSSKLFQLVVEIRSFYLQYQRKLVEQIDDERLRFEFGTIREMEGLEMCVVNTTDKTKEVRFAVSVLRAECGLQTSKHQAVIKLKVIFPVRKGHSWNPTPPSLKLFAPELTKELFDIDDVKLPAWPERMCVAEYIPALQEILKKQMNDAFASIPLRKNFIEGLAIFFGWPLEADIVFGRKVSILTSSGIFYFLVHFTLSTHFPKQQPTIVLQSCLHFDNLGKPLTRSYSDYPWSPRWDTAEMVQRVCDFVVEESGNFKKYCNDALLRPR